MLTRHALTRRADTDGVDGVDANVVERDYVVAQLHHAHPEDGGRLVFKGGTALRFIYLLDYRYSADLDFTAWTAWRSAPVRQRRSQRSLATCVW